MKPILIEIGPITLYSYGLMMALGFIAAYTVLQKEHQRFNYDVKYASTLLIFGIVCGIIGAKILYIFDEWNRFTADPVGLFFSPSGLVWYGGFAGGLLGMVYYIRKKRLPVLRYLDMIGLAGMIGYSVGRIGCHTAGDGDYGLPTELPWGTIYANGTVKPTQAAADYFARNPESADQWNYYELAHNLVGRDRFGPITEFDTTVAMHPTPIYEFIIGIAAFFILWKLRLKLKLPGTLFAVYLIFMSAQRFGIEFIRLNPIEALGMTQAQLFSVALFAAGCVLFYLLKRKEGLNAP
jgi:phosphatidylglycerol---prolipoprotein diacylglyceryl transferase